MIDYIWLVPLLPLVGFLINILVVWQLPNSVERERIAGYVAAGSVLLSFVVSLVAFINLIQLPPEERRVNVLLWEWISLGDFRIPFGLLLDPLSGVMMLLVTGVGGLIHFYSIGYMHGDAKVVRYFSYLNLFIVMMLFLVMSDNLLLLFLGWEGVGLCSFLLIGHWYERKTAAQAAVKAFVVNRIGDAAILLAMMAIFSKFGSLNFFNSNVGGVELQGFVENASLIASQDIVHMIAFLLLIGVTGKSAQIPLFVWLPDAMAGPTPVSALIHAATMVTAGVYLMARTYTIFMLSDQTQMWVTWIGTLTALVAATAAIAQWDIKRVLAYSTVSQLGYMVAAAGMGLYVAAIFHLLTHGIFKALLFLGSGSVIHGTHDTQDMRRMGGLRRAMPVTYWTYVIGALALAGIFPFAGFWSKDEILAHAWQHQDEQGYLTYIFVFLAFTSVMTAFYMGRQIALIFFGKQRDHSYHPHESSSIMTIPLIILAIGSIVGGFLINPPGAHFLTEWLHPVLEEEAGEFSIGLAFVLTVLAVVAGFAGFQYYLGNLGKIKIGGRDPLYRWSGDIWDIFEQAWLFDRMYEKWTVVPWFKGIARFLAQIFDPEGIDGMVNGVGRVVGRAATGVRTFQTGYVRNYALTFLIGVVIILGYLMLIL